MPTAIWNYWLATGANNSPLGLPLDSPQGSFDSSWHQDFENGVLVLDKQDGLIVE